MLSELAASVGAEVDAAPERQTIVALVQRRAGAIERIVSLLRRRAPTFTTLNIAQCEAPAAARVTIGFEGAPQVARQLVAHLGKLVDVSAVAIIPADTPHTGQRDGIVRELALARISCTAQNRRDVIALAQLFGARPVAVDADSLTLEISGDAATIDNALLLARPFGVQALTRTGGVALSPRAAYDATDESDETNGAFTDETTPGAHPW